MEPWSRLGFSKARGTGGGRRRVNGEEVAREESEEDPARRKAALAGADVRPIPPTACRTAKAWSRRTCSRCCGRWRTATSRWGGRHAGACP